MTERIRVNDIDLGRALDGEKRLGLEERREELDAQRNEVVARMTQIERELAEQEENAQALRTSEAKATVPSADVAQVETKPKPAVQLEPEPVRPAQPAQSPSPDRLTISTPMPLELVRVPAGEFLMGSDPAKDKGAFDEEKPQHQLFLPEFYIGKYPVTNEQYAVFVQQTNGAAPEHWKHDKIPSGEEKHPVGMSRGSTPGFSASG